MERKRTTTKNLCNYFNGRRQNIIFCLDYDYISLVLMGQPLVVACKLG